VQVHLNLALLAARWGWAKATKRPLVVSNAFVV